jgi:integrase
MAKFNIVLDTRVKKSNNKYNLAIRMVNGNDVMFLNIVKMTKKQYESVFTRKAGDEDSVKFREDCNTFLSKCESIFAQMNPFDKSRFRELVYQEEKVIPEGLKLKDLFDRYIESNNKIKIRTKDHYKTTRNVFETLKPGLTIWDVNPELLKRFEKEKTEQGCSAATIASYLRHLRRIINYYMKVDNLIPKQYEYPFGEAKYSIRNFKGKRLILSNDEIKRIVEFNDFEDKNQELARDLWVLLYRCNGVNMADMIRMKWSNIRGKHFVFVRMKTENTKHDIEEIASPISPKVQELLDKVGVKDSPYILGYLNEGSDESTFRNKLKKVRRITNTNLKYVCEKLNLSVKLDCGGARYAYASCLKRSGRSTDEISEMLGHSSVEVTKRYLDSLDMYKTDEINDCLF